MSGYDTTKTPDYSPLIVHFTKSGNFMMPDLIAEKHPLNPFKTAPAVDRLLNILQSRTIYATPMPFLPRHASAVCFTECIWEALTRHATRYSPYGVVFSKRLIHKQGGGPALYVRGDVLKALGDSLPSALEPFVAPFDPEAALKPGVRLDWLHEREWRLPESLSFEYHDVEYVIVSTIDDARTVGHQIGAQYLPEDKLIPMEVYETIQEAWSGK